MYFKLIFLRCVLFLTTTCLFSQDGITKILWDKINDKPIAYATIKGGTFYAISNEDGFFEFDNDFDSLTIQNVAYETLRISRVSLQKKDTIYMMPTVYKLDEVVVEKDDRFNTVVKTIVTDYALEPHQESFFLRAIVRKNDSIYKIVDFSGLLERKTLFGTIKHPFPKENYIVQVDNVRKVGMENRILDFELFSFEKLLTQIASVYFSPKVFDITYQISEDYTKMTFNPKNNKDTFIRAVYVVDNECNTFNQVEVIYDNKDANFEHKKDVKFRTLYAHTKSNFQRNTMTNKLQLNMAVFKADTEVFTNKDRAVFKVEYVFYATPLLVHKKINPNVNIKKDIFDINGKYNSVYWENNEILPLTTEMQSFIREMKTKGKKTEFRVKTNIK